MDNYPNNKRDGYTLLFAFIPILFSCVLIALFVDLSMEAKTLIAVVISLFLLFLIQFIVGKMIKKGSL